MEETSRNIVKSVSSELATTATDIGFVALATAAGFPSAVIASPLAKGLVLGVLENCFTDNAQKKLAISEKKKLEKVYVVALETFRELAEKDGVVAWKMYMDAAYADYAYEVADHATMEAIRQSEQKKVELLGRYYGRQLYKGGANWQDMHQMISMAGALSFRQIVMIRLIADDFRGIDKKLFISNPAACVEMNQLLSHGIWQTNGVRFGTNTSWAIQIDSIIPTIYSEQVSEMLMLDKIGDEDINIVIDSLTLTEKGDELRELTEEEFESKTTYKIDGETLILPGGKVFNKGIDDGEY